MEDKWTIEKFDHKKNTKEVIEHFKDRRIKYILHEENKGEGRARNTGVTNAIGEYIAFLDDIEEWFPEKLERQVNVMYKGSSSDIGLVYTACKEVNRDRGNVGETIIPKIMGREFPEILQNNFVILSSVMVRTQCFKEVGLFDTDLPSGLDYDMWIRISERYNFECIPDVLVKYSIHQNRLTANITFQIEGKTKFIEKYEHTLISNSKKCNHNFIQLIMLHYLDGNAKKGRKIWLRYIKLYPFSKKLYALLILSIFQPQTIRAIFELKSRIRNRLLSNS